MYLNEIKYLIGSSAVNYVLEHLSSCFVLGIGTGSTVNCFIDALTPYRHNIPITVSSSIATTIRLRAAGFSVINLNKVQNVHMYIDSTDEIDMTGNMIKGKGGALTGEKIIASISQQFVCIADSSKQVAKLGACSLPVEVIPIAQTIISRRFCDIGGIPIRRYCKNGNIYLTDYGNEIIDVANLKFEDPYYMESMINSWPGVVTTGLFVKYNANIGLFCQIHDKSIKIIKFK